MIERLKCCIYILFAKQYALYTADKYKFGRFGSCYIKQIKTFEDLYKDYPRFNLEKYKEIYDELDEYYRSL